MSRHLQPLRSPFLQGPLLSLPMFYLCLEDRVASWSALGLVEERKNVLTIYRHPPPLHTFLQNAVVISPRTTCHQSSTRATRLANRGAGHVALRQEIAAQTIANFVGVEAVVLPFRGSDGPQHQG